MGDINVALLKAVRCVVENTEDREDILNYLDRIIEHFEEKAVAELMSEIGLP